MQRKEDPKLELAMEGMARMARMETVARIDSPRSCIRASPSLRSSNHSSCPARLGIVSAGSPLSSFKYSLWQPVLKMRLSLRIFSIDSTDSHETIYQSSGSSSSSGTD